MWQALSDASAVKTRAERLFQRCGQASSTIDRGSTHPHQRKGVRVMENRRKDLLNQLEADASKVPLETGHFVSIAFQILYGLPMDLQLRAALHMCERYLPIHEKKLPGSAWVRRLLGDLDADPKKCQASFLGHLFVAGAGCPWTGGTEIVLRIVTFEGFRFSL
jgi:hypothetical protein